QQRILQVEIVDGVSGDAELREHHQVDVVRLSLAHQRERFLRVGRRVTDVDAWRAAGDPDESVRVEGMEAQSALAPENCTTFAHFSVSLTITLPKSSGVPEMGLPPRSASFFCTAGSARH